MTDRREFLAAVAAGVGVARFSTAPTVGAESTVFYGNPDGRTNLVRFRVTDVDVPAGRLRVFDDRGRLAGTAGLLRRGDSLVGELWLPLERRTTVRSELEMPGTRRPIRSSHVLEPQPRWTIYWYTAAHPDQIRELLLGLPALARGAGAALFATAGVRADPVGAPELMGDHVDLLRTAVPARRVTTEFGVPTASAGVLAAGADPTAWGPVLIGSGVSVVLSDREATTATAVGFGGELGTMARQVEAWLGVLDLVGEARAVVIGRQPEDAVRTMPVIADWNQRYAHPRLVIGEPAFDAGPFARAAFPDMESVPGASTVTRWAAPSALQQTRADRARGRFTALARVVAPSQPTVLGIASRFAFPVAGTLVFNPSPFGRSDVVTMPDGTARVVTDVPGLGYAFLPEDDAPPPTPAASSETGRGLSNDVFRVLVDPGSGALTSMAVGADRAELLAPEGANVVSGARVTDTTRRRLPGMGEHIVLERRLARGRVTSTISLYDNLPWLDITNETDVTGDGLVSYEFGFSSTILEIAWDVPGGLERATAPTAFRPLRWTSLTFASGTVLLGIPDVERVVIDDAGRVTLLAPHGRTRMRIGHRGFVMRDDPWRLGWSTDEMFAVSAPGTGEVDLPTFGRMFEVLDPGVAIVGVKPADDGVGTIAYLHELLGVPRTVPLAPGVLHFDGALRTDLTERDLGTLQIQAGGMAHVPLEANGFSAVRLVGMRLAG